MSTDDGEMLPDWMRFSESDAQKVKNALKEKERRELEEAIRNYRPIQKTYDKAMEYYGGRTADIEEYEELQENLMRSVHFLSQDDQAVVMESLFAELDKLRGAGQKEYARRLENAHGNFDRIGEFLNLPPEKVLLVYALKHLDGIASYADGHRSQRESVKGRILDVMVYMALFYGLVLREEGWLPGDSITDGL